MNSVYNRIEKFYKSNYIVFNKLEIEFERKYNIPKKIIKDTVKRILTETVDNGAKNHLLSYNAFISFIIYYVTMGYFILLSFLGKRKLYEEKKYDVLLEDWTLNGFSEFYKRIYDALAHYKIDIFINAKVYHEQYYPQECDLVIEKSVHNHYYSSAQSQEIIYKDFTRFVFYHKLSKESKINIVNIALRLLRYISVYKTDTLNFKTKFLISAGDNYYNALRYYIYKENGIESIILIQNGYRAGSISNNGGDMYTYCDYYLGFGYKNIEIQEGMECNNKLAIGSLRLYDRVHKLNIKKEIKWDIVFIEQLALIKTASFNVDTYIQTVNLLCQFAKKYPQFKINYRVRPKRMEHYAINKPMKSHIEDIDAKLKSVNIIIDEKISENSYEAILLSKVVVFFTSTMGIEALGLNKKVLNCNLDKQEFCLSINNEVGVLVENSYELFEEKLLYLLNNDNDKMKEYFLEKKFQYMNLDGDPINEIVKIIEEKIKND